MLEIYLAQFCTYLLLLNSSIPTGACQSTLNATYIQSGGKNMYNLTEQYYSKKGNNYLHEYVKQDLLDKAGTAYAINTIYQAKEIKYTTKCNVFLCDTIDVDIAPQFQSYTLGWNWSF
jgi:hypothetical protein